MAITPEMISEKSFSSKFKGYNMDEVDDFLDYVMDEVDKLLRENKALQENGGAGNAEEHEKLVKMTAELEATRGKVKALEAAAAAAAGNDETEALRAELATAKRRISDLEAAGNGAAVDTAELNSLRSQLLAAKAQIAQLESTPANSLPSVENDNLKAQLAGKDAEIAELKAEIEALRARPDASADVLAAANAEAEEIINDAKLRSDFMIKDTETQTRKALAAMRAEVDEAQNEFEGLRAKVREMRSRYLVTLQNQMKMFEEEK